MSWNKLNVFKSRYKSNTGDKISGGHLYFGFTEYHANSSTRTSDQTKFGLRLYADQNQETTNNGKRIHGVAIFAFPDKTYNIVVLPEHESPPLFRQLASMDYEVEEVSLMPLIPYRATLARMKQFLTPSHLRAVTRENAAKCELKGQSLLQASNESAEKDLQESCALRIGPEFMSAEEFKTTVDSLAAQGFISPKTMKVLPIFQEAAQAYAAGTLEERSVRKQLLSSYDTQHSTQR